MRALVFEIQRVFKQNAHEATYTAFTTQNRVQFCDTLALSLNLIIIGSPRRVFAGRSGQDK